MKSIVLVSGLLAVVAFSGCSCDGDPVAEGEGEGEDQILEDAIDLCTVYTRGQGAFVGSLFGGGFFRCSVNDVTPDPSAETIAAIREGCAAEGNPTTAEFLTALTGGRVTMNVDNVQACADFVPEAQAQPPEACNALFVPLVAAGGACEQTWDCEGELLCEAVSIASQVLTCAPPAAENEPCLPQVDFVAPSARTCGEGLECQDFVCVVPPPPGPGPQVGDECADAFECGDELRCDLTQPPVGSDPADELGTCQARALVGGVCESGDDCALNPDAEGNPTTTCGPSGTCVTLLADGASCDVAVDVCAAGCSVCRPNVPGAAAATCQDRGAVGAACRSTEDCIHNLVCDEPTNACVTGGGVGASCVDFEDCVDDTLDCVGTCVLRPGLGEACGGAASEACTEGQCIAGQCRAGVVGDPCETDTDCDGVTALCDGSTCIAPPESGPCSIDLACAEGFACREDETCAPIAGAGENCIDVPCDVGLFCNDASVCEAQSEAGAQCQDDAQCLSGTCVRLVCGAEPAGCTSDKGFFQIFVLLAVLAPLRLRRRR